MDAKVKSELEDCRRTCRVFFDDGRRYGDRALLILTAPFLLVSVPVVFLKKLSSVRCWYKLLHTFSVLLYRKHYIRQLKNFFLLFHYNYIYN